MIGIYKITSPSGKVYIGQAVNIERRKKQYIKPNSYKNSIGPKLYNSLVKYGWEAHKHELIEECSLKQLNKKETFYKKKFIKKYGWKKALFCDLYDQGSGPRSKETKQKMSKSQKGKLKPKGFGEKIKNSIKNLSPEMKLKREIGFKYKRTKKHKDELSKRMENIWKDSFKRKRISSKISKNKIGKGLKPIKCDTLFGMKFQSIKEASEKLGICKGNVSAVLKGRIQHIKGLVFSYLI